MSALCFRIKLLRLTLSYSTFVVGLYRERDPTVTIFKRLAMPRSQCKMDRNRIGSFKIWKTFWPECFKAK